VLAQAVDPFANLLLASSSSNTRTCGRRLSLRRPDVWNRTAANLCASGATTSCFSIARRASAVRRHREVNDFRVRKICDDPVVPRPL
jgi:hypothetical protein